MHKAQIKTKQETKWALPAPPSTSLSSRLQVLLATQKDKIGVVICPCGCLRGGISQAPLSSGLFSTAGNGIGYKSEWARGRGSGCWGPEDPESVIYLTSQCWNSRLGASLIPRVIPLGHKLVQNFWTQGRLPDTHEELWNLGVSPPLCLAPLYNPPSPLDPYSDPPCVFDLLRPNRTTNPD